MSAPSFAHPAPLHAPWRLVFFLLLLVPGVVQGQDASADAEGRVPAHLFQAIIELTGWPRGVLPAPDQRFRIGVAGSDDAVADVARLCDGWSFLGQATVVEPVGGGGFERFHVVYVVRGWTGTVPSPSPRGVLVMGEGEAFLDAGGTVAFVRDGERVRFDIDVDRVARSGLRVGAPLLQLARRVVRSSGPLRR